MKKENTLKFVLFLFCICFSVKSYCQCSATFVDTAGSNGNVTFYSIIADTSKHPYCFWTFGDGNDTAGINATHTYLYNYTYMVCLTVYDSTCYDSACHVVQVTNASQIPSCSGNAAFTATANGTLTDFTNSSGNWEIVDFGDGSSSQSSGSNSIFHQYALNGTYQVTALAYTNAGNVSFACDTSTQSITVANVSCKAAFSMYTDTSNYQFYCYDQSLGAVNRKWYINDTLVAINVINFNSDSVTLPPGIYNVCLVISGPGGCQDSTCQSVTFNYTPLCPNVTFSYAHVNGACDTYTFIADTVGSTIDSIDWFLNESFAGSRATDTITLDFSSANNITSQSVTVNAQGPACASSQFFLFTNPASFYVSLDTTVGLHTWYAYPQNVANVASQQWDFGDGTSSDLPYPTHTYATVGYYNVCHTDTLTNLCAYTYCINQYFFRTTQTGGISYFVVIPPLGMQEQKSVTSLKVYPNPSSGLVNFNFENAPNEDTFLKIYNSTGILVKSATLKNGLTTYSLSTAGLATGIYFYEITGNEGSNIHGKIIVSD